jgi:transcriptional regulator with XRE-family HTH domain
MAIGGRIKQIRYDRDLKLEVLARASGLSPASLQDVEDGVTLRPPVSLIRRLADALGVMPSDLVGGYDRKLVEEGWWPPERVRSVVKAIIDCTTAPLTEDELASDAATDLSLVKCLLELRRVSGLDVVPGRFPRLLNTPSQVHDYCVGLGLVVRNRPAPDEAASSG